MSDMHTLSGAYALNALDDVERARFERHLSDCAECREEVDSLCEAAVLLSATEQQTAPAGLREAVLGRVETIRPQPPVLARATRRSIPRSLVAAAAAVVAIGVGAVVLQAVDEPAPDQPAVSGRPDNPADTVFDAPDMIAVTNTLEDGATVTVARSESLNKVAVSTDGLPPADDDTSYQLWIIKRLEPMSAGLLDRGNGRYLLEGTANNANEVAITAEPFGGSEQPRGSFVARVQLESL